MNFKRNFFLFIFCFCFTVNIFSQSKQITENEYYQAYRNARNKLSNISYRETTKEEYYKDKKQSDTAETVIEFLPPNMEHYFFTENYSGQIRKDELIKIGETYFCRNKSGNWEKSQNWCAAMRLSGLSNIVESKFSVEETKINNKPTKLYQSYITTKGISEKDKEVLYYHEDKFWVSNEGLLMRQEMESGTIEPKKVTSKTSVLYELNPKNLKIEAPIIKDEAKQNP